MAEILDPQVETLAAVSAGDIEDFARLLPQLNDMPAPGGDIIHEFLQRSVESENTAIMIIRDHNGHIQACATANLCPIPSGEKAWVDDVVTDKEYRGLGLARMLMEGLHGWFLDRGANTSNLTSAPSRVVAGGLYESMGYRERDTRVYRAKLVQTDVAE